jgi:hypothetical protein
VKKNHFLLVLISLEYLFWLWADIKGYGTLFAFAQTVDPLIEDGWAVSQKPPVLVGSGDLF